MEGRRYPRSDQALEGGGCVSNIKPRLYGCITQILAGNHPSDEMDALGEEACRLLQEITKQNATSGTSTDGVKDRFASDPYRVGDRHES